MITIEKEISVEIGRPTVPMLKVDGVTGLLQSHLAQLLEFNDHGFSIMIGGLGIEKTLLSRENAATLKKMGVINRYTRGGNFLPLKSVLAVLNVTQSEASRSLKIQFSCPL